jgi:hypothetical protein
VTARCDRDDAAPGPDPAPCKPEGVGLVFEPIAHRRARESDRTTSKRRPLCAAAAQTATMRRVPRDEFLRRRSHGNCPQRLSIVLPSILPAVIPSVPPFVLPSLIRREHRRGYKQEYRREYPWEHRQVLPSVLPPLGRELLSWEQLPRRCSSMATDCPATMHRAVCCSSILEDHVTARRPRDHVTKRRPCDRVTTTKPRDHVTTRKPRDHVTTRKPRDHVTARKPRDRATTRKPHDHVTTKKPTT